MVCVDLRHQGLGRLKVSGVVKCHRRWMVLAGGREASVCVPETCGTPTSVCSMCARGKCVCAS